jgi:hypothetical protein
MGQSIGTAGTCFRTARPATLVTMPLTNIAPDDAGSRTLGTVPSAYSEQSDQPLMKHLTVEVVRSNRAE